MQEAIDSIWNQTFKPDELILLDDGSKDHTWQVIQRNAEKNKKVRTIKHESNLGNIRSYNHCFDLVQGDFIHLMAADDLLQDKYFYEEATLTMMRDTEVAFCSLGIQWMEEEGRLMPTQILPPIDGKVGPLLALDLMRHKGNFTNGGGTLIRKNVQRQVGYYDRSLPLSADAMNWIKVFGLGYSAYYFQRPGYLYRKYPEQMSRMGNAPDSEALKCGMEINAAMDRAKILEGTKAAEKAKHV